MALQTLWYFTGLPQELVSIIEKETAAEYDDETAESRLLGGQILKEKRNSENAWISTNTWLGGFCWHYVMQANKTNFIYDISHFDGQNLQYTTYKKGMFYDWHTDAGLPNATGLPPLTAPPFQRVQRKLERDGEYIRKLSFTLQLSDPTDYEGGNVEVQNDAGEKHILPRQKGSIAIFDSRARHRVNEVTEGTRKSIVGWVVGPNWR